MINPRQESLDLALNGLVSWTGSLKNEATSAEKQIRKIMDASRLPKGCPGHASMSLLMLSGVRQQLEEAQAAYQDLTIAIQKFCDSEK